MNADASPICPSCGIPIPADAPQGLCPRCLGAMHLGGDTLGDDEEVPSQPMLAPEELAPHFPQLEILACLGRGGMGVVYKARQRSLNRLVALKLLAPERVQDAQFAARFTSEALALAQLAHPHIVTVYDFGQSGGFYFLLMEFVDGVNLRQALHAGRFTPEQALSIVPPVCEALQFAHDHGIVHRDIKPENLLLDKSGRVKIADFGIARMMHAGVAESGVRHAAGTPQYMAPEQHSAPTSADHRADVYSLGVVLYEMLTGELPAANLQPPSRKVTVDFRIDEIVMRALERSPELRWQTASELRTSLAAFVSDRPLKQHVTSNTKLWTWLPQTRRAIIMLALEMLGLALFAIFFVRPLLWPEPIRPAAIEDRPPAPAPISSSSVPEDPNNTPGVPILKDIPHLGPLFQTSPPDPRLTTPASTSVSPPRE